MLTPHIDIIKIRIDKLTGDLSLTESILDNRKLYAIFLTLAEKFKPTEDN